MGFDAELNALAPAAISFVFVVARLSGMFLVAPILSSPLIPARVKGMILVVLAASMTPMFLARDGADALPMEAWGIALGIGREALIGFAMGYAISLIFAAIQFGAHLIDLSAGFALANIVDPLTHAQASVFGAFYTIVASLIFLTFDGHHLLVQGFAASYHLVPLDGGVSIAALTQSASELFVQLFSNAFRIAAPVLVTLLLSDVVLGLMARVVPQMNVFFVGLPLKIAVGMIGIVLTLPTFATFFEERVHDIAVGVGVLTGG